VLLVSSGRTEGIQAHAQGGQTATRVLQNRQTNQARVLIDAVGDECDKERAGHGIRLHAESCSSIDRDWRRNPEKRSSESESIQRRSRCGTTELVTKADAFQQLEEEGEAGEKSKSCQTTQAWKEASIHQLS